MALLLVPTATLVTALHDAPAASADATFLVNSTSDAGDASPGNGACATGAGTCTLRAAIQESNALAGRDTIQVPAGTYNLTIAPVGDNLAESGDLDITAPVTIVGAGAASTIVDGGNPPGGASPEQTALDRLVEIHPNAGDVTISGLTLREGWAEEAGGALFNSSEGTVRLQGIGVRDSFATAYGGGIYHGESDLGCVEPCLGNTGNLELASSTVDGQHHRRRGRRRLRAVRRGHDQRQHHLRQHRRIRWRRVQRRRGRARPASRAASS